MRRCAITIAMGARDLRQRFVQGNGAVSRLRSNATPVYMSYAFLFLFVLSSHITSAKDLIDENWIEVRSPHFTIVSALSTERTVAAARDLENFRAAAELFPEIGRIQERVPMRAYVLPYTSAALAFTDRKSGILLSTMHANYAQVIVEGNEMATALKYTYGRYFARGRDELVFAAWLDEGFAQLLSTLHVKGTTIEIGDLLPSNGRVLGWGNWMQFNSLLAAHDPAGIAYWHTRQFAAQSWLLVHYLMIGRPEVDFASQLQTYLRLTNEGVDDAQAFTTAFGLEVADLRKVLRQYMRDVGLKRRLLQEPFPVTEVKIRPLARDQIAAELGELLDNEGRNGEARQLFDASLAINPKNIAALIGSVRVADAPHHDAALRNLDTAIAVGPENAMYELDYGELLYFRAKAAPGTRQASADLTAARMHLARSYKLNADFVESLVAMGLTYLEPGEAAQNAMAPLLTAYAASPSNPKLRVYLAMAYAANHQLDKARAHARALLHRHDVIEPEEMEATLIALDKRP